MTNKPIQIAVITNDPERAEVVETTSNLFNWHVDANSGHMQPLNWLLAQSVDLVLVDIDIPNSVQLVADISKTVSELALLALVAPDRLIDLQPILTAGAQDFVALPLNPDHYHHVVERAIESPVPTPQKQPENVSPVRELLAEGEPVPASSMAVENGSATPHDDLLEREVPPALQLDSMDTSSPEPDTITAPEPITIEDVSSQLDAFMEPSASREPEVMANHVPLHESVDEPLKDDNAIVNEPSMAPPSMDFAEAPIDSGLNGHRLPEAMANPASQSRIPSADGAASSTALVKVNEFNQGDQITPPVASSLPFSSPHGSKRLIAVVGLRGGVGRSTIAANLALALAKNDLGSVALVEAHHNLSHLAMMLHLHPRNTLAGFAEAKSLDLDIVQGHLQSHGSGIKVLAAPSHLDDLIELSGEQWTTILAMTQELSPMVVVDTGAAVDVALLETLVLATDIIVVMNPEIASLRGTTALVSSLYTEAEVEGNIHVVLNRSGVGGGLDEGTIRKQLGHELAATLPDDPGLATYAMNRGVPFVHSHARSLLTKRVKALADKVVTGANEPVVTKPSARSLLPFLNVFG